MQTEVVSAPSGSYLAAVRRVLDGADEALVCVAFAQARGVHLIAKELEAVCQRGSARTVVTTTLGTSSPVALAALENCKVGLRVLNPGGMTFHPKVFLGRSGEAVRAVVGSANLTSGLVANVELGVAFDGTRRDPTLAQLWSWAEEIWDHKQASAWQRRDEGPDDEAIEPELLVQLAAAARENPTVYTLGPAPKPNFVREVNASGMWVETERSRRQNEEDGSAPAQLVPPRMLNLAWDALGSRGRLTNRELLEELRVHRSSFVCAVLARLPGVKREDGREIVLSYGERQMVAPPKGIQGRRGRRPSRG